MDHLTGSQPGWFRDQVGRAGSGRSFWMMALGKFQGTGIWLESLSRKGPGIWEFGDGRYRSGQVQELLNAPVKVHAGQGFALESWTGGDLWVLQACVAPGSREVGEVVRAQLWNLGFHWDLLLNAGHR